MRKPAIFFFALVLLYSCKSNSCKSSRQINVGQPGNAAKGGSAQVPKAPPPNLFPVRVKDKFGYIDRTGKLVLKADFAGASRFSEGLAAVQLQKYGKVGYIDETGKVIIPPQFDLADPFSEGAADVMKNRLGGYIDKSGQAIIAPRFGAAGRFSEGAAAVAALHGSSLSFNYITRKGNLILRTDFESAMPFSEGVAAVRVFGELIGFIDQSGKKVIPPKYTSAGEFSEGLAPVELHTT